MERQGSRQQEKVKSVNSISRCMAERQQCGKMVLEMGKEMGPGKPLTNIGKSWRCKHAHSQAMT